MVAKIVQTLTTPTGTNEQTGVGQATVTATTTFVDRGIFTGCLRAMFCLDVSAVSGTTPSMVVTLQGLDPISLKWNTFVTFPAQTAVTPATPLAPITVDPLFYQKVRAVATVTGTTPSFTFSLGAIMIGDG